ncbi:IS1182 family transposase, partial [Flavobacterium sp. DGU38]
QQANKHVLMASLTYNLKKYLRFIARKPKSQAGIVSQLQGKAQAFSKSLLLGLKQTVFSLLFFENKTLLQK